MGAQLCPTDRLPSPAAVTRSINKHIIAWGKLQTCFNDWQEKRVLIISTNWHAGPRRRNVPWALIWFCGLRLKQAKLCMCVCVCVCVYQVEGCLEMTELHTCLWLWSAYGKHSKSEGNRKYPPSDTNKFNKRRSLSRHLGAFPRRASRTLSIPSPNFPSNPICSVEWEQNRSVARRPTPSSAGVSTGDVLPKCI